MTLLLLILTVSAVDGAAAGLSALTRMPKKLCAATVIILALALASTVGAYLVSALFSECRQLLLSLSEGRGTLILFIDSLLCRAEEIQNILIPFSHGDTEYLSEAVSSLINKGVANLLSALGRWVASVIGKAPSIIGASIFFTVCAVWLSLDLDGIRRETRRILPEGAGDALLSFLGRARRAIAEYAASHLILFLIVFAETYVGLLIIQAPFALALSALVAAVDILPLLGAGAVLLPMAVWAAVSGSYGLCVGLLVLLFVICVTRQIAEPYVVGRRIGVHPFLSFLSTFIGLALFGASGAIILPLLLSLAIRDTNT